MDILIGDYVITDSMKRFDLWLSMKDLSTFEAEFIGEVPEIPSTNILITEGSRTIFSGTGQIASGVLSAENEVSQLASIKVSQTLLQCDPQEIITATLSSVGLELNLEKTVYPKKKVFVIGGLSGLELLEKITEIWNRPFQHFVLNGKLYWGELNLVKDTVVRYETGVNIIDMVYDSSTETGKLIGFLDCSLLLGQIVEITDNSVPIGTFAIDKLHHYKQANKSRTEIYFRRVGE